MFEKYPDDYAVRALTLSSASQTATGMGTSPQRLPSTDRCQRTSRRGGQWSKVGPQKKSVRLSQTSLEELALILSETPPKQRKAKWDTITDQRQLEVWKHLTTEVRKKLGETSHGTTRLPRKSSPSPPNSTQSNRDNQPNTQQPVLSKATTGDSSPIKGTESTSLDPSERDRERDGDDQRDRGHNEGDENTVNNDATLLDDDLPPSPVKTRSRNARLLTEMAEMAEDVLPQHEKLTQVESLDSYDSDLSGEEQITRQLAISRQMAERMRGMSEEAREELMGDIEQEKENPNQQLRRRDEDGQNPHAMLRRQIGENRSSNRPPVREEEDEEESERTPGSP